MRDNRTLDQQPNSDDVQGMAWWNGLSEADRALWLTRAGGIRSAKDAWEAFKQDRQQMTSELAGLDDAIAGRTTTAATWIRDQARRHGVTFAETPVDTFAAGVSRLSDAGVQLDETEQLLLALERAGIVSGTQSFALHAAYLRQSRA